MSATFILTTRDGALEADWARQLPSRPLPAGDGDLLARELQRPGARVWIRDICDGTPPLTAHRDTVVVVIGEPRSLPYEEAKQSREVTYCLSYEESRTELGRVAAIAAELAESRAVLAVLQERSRRAEPAPAETSEPSDPGRRGMDDLEFLAASIEHLGDRNRIIDEFRRGVRIRVRASRVLVFLKEEKRYLAEAEGLECSSAHDLVLWLHEHAAIVETSTLDAVESPKTEAALRQKLGEWNTRLLVPLEVHGSLEGWVALGPRADGRGYSPGDREDVLMMARLLSMLLGQNRLMRSALAVKRDVGLIQKHGPRFCVVGAAGVADMTLPVEARETAAVAIREGRRVEREFGRIRVAAGPVPESGGCWLWWDESSLTEESTAQKREAERHQILHDLGIMISHELANAMFSVSTYFQHIRRQRTPDEPAHPLLDRVAQDMERMKAMPHLFSTLYEMSKLPTGRVDMRRVVQSVAKEVGGQANTPDSGILIWGHEKNLHDALVWLCREVLETRDRLEAASRDSKITVSLQQRRRDEEMICLVTISCPGLRLDQVKIGEATSTEEYPTVPVYLAREVIRFHYGTVHVGQGLDGPELMIAIKSRKVNVIAEVDSLARKAQEGASATPFEGQGRASSSDPEAFPASA
jgi:hypothetical protein